MPIRKIKYVWAKEFPLKSTAASVVKLELESRLKSSGKIVLYYTDIINGELIVC